MANKIKRLTKIGTIILGITFILWNCQRDETTAPVQKIEETHQDNYSISYVPEEKIPNIINILGSVNNFSSKTSSSKSNSISASFGVISIENVLEVVDTLGNQNYSFVLLPKTPKPNSIFNLVINNANGSNNMAILEYRMTADFAENYNNGTKTFANFTGSILTFPFSPASNIFAKSNGDTCIQNIDEIVDCSVINVNNGSVTGSGGGGSTSIGDISDPQAGNTGGGFTTGGGGSAVWVCTPCGVSHSTPSECRCSGSGNGSGGGGAEGTWIVTLRPYLHTYKSNNTKSKSSTTSCCDGTDTNGSIGVNLLTPQIKYITNCIPDLTQDQIDFLNSSLISFKIKNFLENNKNPNGTCNQNANELTKHAIEVLRIGNATQKEFANAILKDDIETATQILIGDNQTINCCQYNPNCCDEIFDPMVQITTRIVIDARDSFLNLIQAWMQHSLLISKNSNGKYVREVMQKIGVEVPLDIENETLAELFKIRYRNLDLVIEPVGDYLDELLDVGISIIDVLAIVSPSKGAGAFIFAKAGTGTITAKALSEHLKTMANIAKTTLQGGKGYKSFSAFKRAHGNAPNGNALHHIVEQNGFQSLNQLKFGRTNIHNTKNIIDIPNGAGELHRRITGYYNSIDRTLHPTKKVREAIKDWSFKEQYDFGIRKLKEFGWDGVTGVFN